MANFCMCLDKFQPVIPLGSYDAFSSLWCFSLLKYGLDFFPFTPDIYWGGLQKVCFCQFLAEYLCHLWARGRKVEVEKDVKQTKWFSAAG